MANHQGLATIESIINEARNGRMIILVDDEDRENEGDLILPAQLVTPDAIAFMAKYGSGLICLSLTQERIQALNLSLMPQSQSKRLQTGFATSIEAREGVSTGISASDRARTIMVATDSNYGPHDIVTPGHVFPLQARNGGVLVRAGHTEAAIDLARLAGLRPAGVICEIMKDDGTMARLPDLIEFGQKHQIKIGTIADLIAYRLKHDRLVERSLTTQFLSLYGGAFELSIYINKIEYSEHLALVCGDITTPEPVLVRMHTLNLMNDVLGDISGGKADELHQAMRMIAKQGRGVIVLLREPSATSASDYVKLVMGGNHQSTSHSTNPNPHNSLRVYGVGAQILLDLGVGKMILLSNAPKTIVGLTGYGLEIIEQRPIH